MPAQDAHTLMRLLPDGVPLTDYSGRLLGDQATRDGWQMWLRQRQVSDVIATHPRRRWLDAGFNTATYLGRRQDVAGAVDTAAEAAFHYLEFGIEEGEHGRPTLVDPAFVLARHGLHLPDDISAGKALALLHRAGVNHLACPLTEVEHWALHGFDGPGMAARFDHDLYHAFARLKGHAPWGRDRLACIDHFVTTGLGAMISIGDGLQFDSAFYHAEITDLSLPSPQDNEPQTLYRHWAACGIRHGAQPNAAAWAKARMGINLPSSCPDLRAVLGLCRLDSEIVVLRKLAEVPERALAGIDLSDPAQADAVMDLADHLCRENRVSAAISLMHPVLREQPDSPRALLRLAELHEGDTVCRPAVISWRAHLARLVDMPANDLSLAALHLAEDDLGRCIDVLCRAVSRVQGDLVQKGRLRGIAQQVFDRIWHDLPGCLERFGLPAVQRLLADVLVALSPPFSTADRPGPVRRVAIVGTGEPYQCKIYRMDQKAEQLRSVGLTAQVFSGPSASSDFAKVLKDFDAVIFFRMPAFPQVIDAIIAAAQFGLLTFYDIDDLVFDTAHFPPPLETYAGQISPMDHAVMACGVPLFAHAMSLCDYGLASTETLRVAMAARVRRGQAFLHCNGIGTPHLAAVKRANAAPKVIGGPVTIFYGSGTKAHKDVFHDILEPALAALLRSRPGKVRLRLLGEFGGFRHLDPDDPAIEVVTPIWDFESYLDILATVDINLSILARSPDTEAKSEIKWSEAALFGIPSVVSPTATMIEVIADGRTGILCTTSDDYATALTALVDQPHRRAAIGAAAQAAVLQSYGTATLGQSLKSVFDRLRPDAPRKPKLLIVNVFYPPQAIGGATRVVHDNVTDLHQRYAADFDIEVLCTLEGGRTPYEVTVSAKGGVRVWAITAANGAATMTAQDPLMGDAFSRVIDEVGPDLVHFHCIQRLTAAVVDVARSREIPYVITPHDGWWISPHQFVVDAKGCPETYDYRSPMLPPRARILHRCLTDAAAVLPVSHAFADLHRAAGLDRVAAVPNGVSAMTPIPRQPAPDDRVRLALIGGAARHKGFMLLRQAIEAGGFKRLHLTIVDHGQLPGTERKAIWGSTPVRFIPMCRQSQVAALYAQIDVLLAPSIWPESFGLVTREALQCGLWVIASDRGAMGHDVVEGKNGHIVDVSDDAGLMAALSRVDAQPEVYRQAPPQGLPLRNAADQVDDLVRVYREILREAKD